jgi:hypothetical protein
MTKEEKKIAMAKARKIQENATAMRSLGADDARVMKALKEVLLVGVDVSALLSAKTDSELWKTLAPWFETMAKMGHN